MALKRTLGEDEYVVLNLRTHIKALFPAFGILFLVAAGWIALAIFLPESSVRGWVHLAVAVVALVVILVWVVVPFLRWITSRYTITNRRLITRSGIIARTGRDIPLHRINDVAYEKGFTDRLLGCGTLVVSDATEKAGVVLPDVPHVESVHVQLHDLLFAADDGSDGGEFSPIEPRRR